MEVATFLDHLGNMLGCSELIFFIVIEWLMSITTQHLKFVIYVLAFLSTDPRCLTTGMTETGFCQS